MLETTPTGTRENGPYDMWDKCLEESKEIILKYKDGKHLAPNGLPSRLPELYAKITRTPTFLNWFGDWRGKDKTNVSKVVYEDTEEPRLVFHSTKRDIPPEQGLQPQVNKAWKVKHNKIFFTSNKEDSKSWVVVVPTDFKGSVFECFLNIKKPKIVNNHIELREFVRYQNGKNEKYDGIIQKYGWVDYVIGDSDQFVVEQSNQVMHLPSRVETINK
jgi:hypothetical protein